MTTRHYYEQAEPAAMDPELEPRMRIECLDSNTVPAPPSDESVAAGIRRVCNALRSRTLEMPALASGELPAFMALTPNEFPPPQTPGNFGLAAFDAHYSMAPFFISQDEALVITGRWPDCRFGNVCLWNRFQQTFDYSTRSVALNRSQTVLEEDGSFSMILAHEDPGLPNWLDTEGNLFGLVFWRFFLVEGEAADTAGQSGQAGRHKNLKIEVAENSVTQPWPYRPFKRVRLAKIIRMTYISHKEHRLQEFTK